MNVDPREPARRFTVAGVEISHVADVSLEPDEQITFVTGSGTEWDVVRKSWGWYSTPSLNRRLREHGLRAALCANADGRVTLLMVEPEHEDEFTQYLNEHSMRVLHWLDADDAAERLGG